MYRQAIEYEKKGYAENYEQGQVMETNLISMARELEKLRAEVANAEKRARAAAAAGHQGICFPKLKHRSSVDFVCSLLTGALRADFMHNCTPALYF